MRCFAPDGHVLTINDKKLGSDIYVWIAEALPIYFQSCLSVHYCARGFSLSLELSKISENKTDGKTCAKLRSAGKHGPAMEDILFYFTKNMLSLANLPMEIPEVPLRYEVNKVGHTIVLKTAVIKLVGPQSPTGVRHSGPNDTTSHIPARIRICQVF